jgi:hypothetical protein
VVEEIMSVTSDPGSSLACSGRCVEYMLGSQRVQQELDRTCTSCSVSACSLIIFAQTPPLVRFELVDVLLPGGGGGGVPCASCRVVQQRL